MHESVLIYKILGEIKPKLTPEYSLKKVTLEVGEFSCVNTKTLTQLFNIAKKSTFAKNSKLNFSIIKDDFDIKLKSIEVNHEG